MAIYRTVTHFYGVRVPDDTDWTPLEEDPGQCRNNGGDEVLRPEIYHDKMGYLTAGAYNRNMVFLALNWKHIEPGEYVLHDGVHAVAPKFLRDRWNDDLRALADRLGLEIIDGPGWLTMPDEG